MRLTGTCTTVISGSSERGYIEFDTASQEIAIWMPCRDLKDALMGGQSIVGERFVVRDICVFSPTAEFLCHRLPPVFVSSYGGAGFSVDHGEINSIMGIGDDQVHAKRIGLKLRKSKLVFDVRPFTDDIQLSREAILTNSGRHINQRFTITIGRQSVEIRYSPKHIFFTGRIRDRDLDVLRHTCILIALTHEELIAYLKPPKLQLNYAWARPKAYTEPVLTDGDLPSAFQQVIDFLLTCKGKERQTRFHEIMHLAAGFDQRIFLEHRLTNLLKALESFDGTRTMSPNRLGMLFKISKGDAQFLCGVRNCLMHRGMPLAEAAEKTWADMVSQRIQMVRFSRLPQSRRLAWRLYVTFARLIVSAYYAQLGRIRTRTLYSTTKGF